MFLEALKRIEELGGDKHINSSTVPIYDIYGNLVPWNEKYTRIIGQVAATRNFPYCILENGNDIAVLIVSRERGIWSSELIKVRDQFYLTPAYIFRDGEPIYYGAAYICTWHGIQWIHFDEYMTRMCLEAPLVGCWPARVLKVGFSHYEGFNHLVDAVPVYSAYESIPEAIKHGSLYVFDGKTYTKLYLDRKEEKTPNE